MSSLITDDLFATPSENSVKRKPGEFKLIAPDAAVELEFDASRMVDICYTTKKLKGNSL